VCMLFRAHMRAPAAIPWIPRMERRAYDPTGTCLAVSHVVHGGVTGLAEALIESFGRVWVPVGRVAYPAITSWSMD
jgi:hypothetical protein